MLTRQGWLVAGGGAVGLAAARLFGSGELYVFGAMAIGLVACAALLMRFTRLDVGVERAINPTRLHVGQASRIDVRVCNRRRADTPVLRLRDRMWDDASVELLVPPLGPGAAATARYLVPTDRRGTVRIGPLQTTVGDPFGLAESSTIAAPQIELTVLPAVDAIRPPPFTMGHDPTGAVVRPRGLGRVGDDFYALRPYVVGDDLRHIHWPSTARHDELLVRQNEEPWQGRTTVLLDVRRAVHDAASFERAVSAAASVIAASSGRRDLVRLITTDGTDSGFSSGAAHLAAILERLAVVERSGTASWRKVVDLLERMGEGGVLVAVAGETTRDDLGCLGRLDRRFASIVLVHVVGAATDGGSGMGGPGPGPSLWPPVVRIDDGVPFAQAWEQMLRRQGGSAIRRTGAQVW